MRVRELHHVAMAVGGTILFVGVLMMVWNVAALLRSPRGETEYPVAEAESAEPVPTLFERWGVWLGVLAALIVAAYAVPFSELLNSPNPGSKPWITW